MKHHRKTSAAKGKKTRKVARKKKTIARKASRSKSKPTGKVKSRTTKQAQKKSTKKPARRKEPKGKPTTSRKPKLAVKSSRIEELRAMLEARRAEILEEIKRARQDSIETDRTSFPEVGDLVSASVEKEKAFEYGEAGVNALREIDLALEKLEEGTYGICESCGKPISLKRLRIMPSARLCIRCKAKEEATKLSHDRLNRYPSVFVENEGED